MIKSPCSAWPMLLSESPSQWGSAVQCKPHLNSAWRSSLHGVIGQDRGTLPPGHHQDQYIRCLIITGRGPGTGSTSHFKHCPAFSHKHGIMGAPVKCQQSHWPLPLSPVSISWDIMTSFQINKLKLLWRKETITRVISTGQFLCRE